MRALSASAAALVRDLDLLGDGLGAADQQLLEAADAGVEGVRDLHGAGAERLVDVVDLGADRLGELRRRAR